MDPQQYPPSQPYDKTSGAQGNAYPPQNPAGYGQIQPQQVIDPNAGAQAQMYAQPQVSPVPPAPVQQTAADPMYGYSSNPAGVVQPQPIQNVQAMPSNVPPAQTMQVPPSQPAFMQSNPTYPGVRPVSPVVPVSQQKSSILRKIIVMVVVLVVLAGVGIGAWIFLKPGKAKTGNSATSSGSKSSGDVVDRTDSTLDLSNLIDENTTIKQQSLTGKLFQQINLSDGTSYMVTAVERNYNSKSSFLQPDSGKEMIKVTVVIGNRTKAGSVYATGGLFRLKNSAGGLQDTVFATSSDDADALKSADIASGKQVKGAIFFQVDKNEKSLKLTTNEQYQDSVSKKQVTITSEVALQ